MSTLKQMPGHTRLYRRNAVYYHRAAVPQDIRHAYGKREETFSLGTRDFKEAVRRVREAAVKVDRKFEAFRAKLASAKAPPLEDLTSEQEQRFEDLYYAHLLEEDEETRFDRFENPEDAVPLDADPPPSQVFEPRPTFEEHAEAASETLQDARYLLARGESSVFFDDEVHEVATWAPVNLRVASGSPGHRKAVRALLRATKRAAEDRLARNEGEDIRTPDFPCPASQAAPHASTFPLLSEAVDQWLKEKKKELEPKAYSDYEHWNRVFLLVNGDRPLDTYGKTDGRAFKNLLEKLPPNASKKKELRGLNAVDGAERANALGMAPMSDTNIKKALRRVGTFWSWAGVNYFDAAAPEPVKGLAGKSKVAARDQRHPFSPDQLERIFSAPVYTGCASERKWSDPGHVVLRDSSKFWVPLIGLFTGARLGEICSLYPSDIQCEGDIWYLSIGAEDGRKRVKTSAAQRRIPLHRSLVSAGLPEFASQKLSEGALWLFDDIGRETADQRNDRFSKHFSRYLRRCGAKTDKNAFHSFRHNFEDACRNAEVDHGVMNALQGHSQSGMAGRYGDGQYRLPLLNRAVQSLDFGVSAVENNVEPHVRCKNDTAP